MYERFTDRARKVMQLANQEAQRFNHEYIGTEHVLLGLIKEGSGVAANVLKPYQTILDLTGISWLVTEATGGKIAPAESVSTTMRPSGIASDNSSFNSSANRKAVESSESRGCIPPRSATTCCVKVDSRP